MRALIGTRKGLFRLEHRRGGWHIDGPHFLGVGVTNAVLDPRDRSIWALLDHGHWGPKLHVSRDGFRTFRERPCPAFPEGCVHDAETPEGPRKGPASVRRLYAFVPAGPDAGSYHCGTDPGGLFSTEDGGDTWSLDDALWERRNADGWFEGGGGLMLHTVLVHPGDPRRLHVAVSCAGVYESRDAGATWTPRNAGVRADFLPDRWPEVGQDVHMLRRHPREHDLLWQQNHCGNFRSTDGGRSWTDVMPDSPNAVGFALALHDDDPGVAWTVPMDSDERRVAREGVLRVCRTVDGGATWQELTRGLPQRHCYDIVFRHALDAREDTVVFGTTCGRVFASRDRGDSWDLAAPFLPPVSSVFLERP